MPQELTETTTTGQAGQWFAKLQGMGPVIGLVVLCVVGTLLIGVPCAYALARSRSRCVPPRLRILTAQLR